MKISINNLIFLRAILLKLRLSDISGKQLSLFGKTISICFLYFVSFTFSAWASCTGSSPNWTTTPDYASVKSCVDQANPQDTINVTAGTGSVTWSSSLEIRKGISLIGPGADKLIITAGPVTNLIVYAPSSETATHDYPLRISGFTLNHGTYRGIAFCSSYKNGMCAQASSYYMGAGTAQTKIRIDSNTFNGTSGVAIEIAGPFRGVIDSNIFSGHRTVSRAWGVGVGQADWNSYGPYQYGSSDSMYFEDNTISAGGYMVNDCAQGGRYVYRYNTINATDNLQPIWDYHGGDSGNGVWGCFGGEIYGNKINRNGYNVYFIGSRSAKVLGYNNVLDSSDGSGYWKVYDGGTSSSPCPPLENKSDQLIQSQYYFGNRRSLTGTLIGTSAGSNVCGDVIENKTFWQDVASFNGSAGVGCGTLENMPNTCTPGVAYWATNQSCTNLTGMVGKNPSTAISGKLYKCIAPNTWQQYYTPLPYPHPLRKQAIGTGLPVPVIRIVDVGS